MPEKLEPVKIIIDMLATREVVNEELGDLLLDIRELAENRGFIVLL